MTFTPTDVQGNNAFFQNASIGGATVSRLSLWQQTGFGVPPTGNTCSSLYSGNGVPPATLGVNGDFYFRFDTPGTTNQRLYVKNGGAWTGIL